MLYLCLNSQWQHNYLPSHTAHSMAETESTQQGWCKQPCNEYWQSSRPDALSTSSRTHQCQWPVLKSVTSHCMPTILKILPATSTIHPSSKWIWISKKIKFYKSKFELENKPNDMCAWDRCTVSDCRTVCIGLWYHLSSTVQWLSWTHLSVCHNVIGADYHAVIAVACNLANSSANAQYLHAARISDPR